MKFFVFVFSIIIFAQGVGAQDFAVPPLRHHVNDYASILPAQTERQLNNTLTAVKDKTGIELVVLTVSSLDGVPIESASIKVVDQWKLGTAKEDKGLLLFVALKDRKIRIEVGQGLEGTLTDADSKRIIDQSMVPLMRSQNYSDAIVLATFQMLSTAAPETDFKPFYEGHIQSQSLKKPSRKKSSWIIIVFWILLIFFGGRSGLLPLILLGGMGRGHYRGGGGFGGGGFGGGGGLGGGGGFSGGGASGGW